MRCSEPAQPKTTFREGIRDAVHGEQGATPDSSPEADHPAYKYQVRLGTVNGALFLRLAALLSGAACLEQGANLDSSPRRTTRRTGTRCDAAFQDADSLLGQGMCLLGTRSDLVRCYDVQHSSVHARVAAAAQWRHPTVTFQTPSLLSCS